MKRVLRIVDSEFINETRINTSICRLIIIKTKQWGKIRNINK